MFQKWQIAFRCNLQGRGSRGFFLIDIIWMSNRCRPYKQPCRQSFCFGYSLQFRTKRYASVRITLQTETSCIRRFQLITIQCRSRTTTCRKIWKRALFVELISALLFDRSLTWGLCAFSKYFSFFQTFSLHHWLSHFHKEHSLSVLLVLWKSTSTTSPAEHTCIKLVSIQYISLLNTLYHCLTLYIIA